MTDNIEEGLIDTSAKILSGAFKTIKSKLPASKMQVTTPAGKTFNMPRGASGTEVSKSVTKTGSGLKPVGVGTAAAAAGAVGTGVYAAQTAKNEPASSTSSSSSSPTTPATTAAPKPAETTKPTETPKTSTKPMSFSQAFKSAREKAGGAGGKFEYGGKKFQTNIKGEKYQPASKLKSVDVDTPKAATPEVPLPPKRPEELKSQSESGGKKKMSEETNPLIAAFLKLQSENPSNMFEAAKKAKKDYDKDGKVESPKDEVWGSRFRAAKAAGKMEEEVELDEISDKTLMSYRSKRLNQIDKMSKDIKSSSKSKNVDPDKIRKNLVGIKTAHKKLASEEIEEIEFSQAEIDHINSFFLEASVAPNRPEVARGADSTSDKMSQNDVTVTAESGGKKRVREEVELQERDQANALKRKSMDAARGAKYKLSNPVPVAEPEHKTAQAHNKAIGRALRNEIHNEETLEEGRPKKNPTPETNERDPRQHIQVAAGRAAAGSVIDFPHNDGSKSKITPAMGRKITSHLNSLKPAERQAAVNKMHASSDGLKI